MSKMYWRKSAQWSSLIRKHAQLVADDMAVADIFAKYCRVGTDKKTGKQHTCISDEVRAAASPHLSFSFPLLLVSQKSMQTMVYFEGACHAGVP